MRGELVLGVSVLSLGFVWSFLSFFFPCCCRGRGRSRGRCGGGKGKKHLLWDMGTVGNQGQGIGKKYWGGYGLMVNGCMAFAVE